MLLLNHQTTTEKCMKNSKLDKDIMDESVACKLNDIEDGENANIEFRDDADELKDLGLIDFSCNNHE